MTLVVISILLFSSTIIFGGNNNSSNFNLTPNTIPESYVQDFSDWTGITRTGDQPNSWILNSDPAQYTVVNSGFYGTYLNLITSGVSLTNYSFNMEWDVKQDAPSNSLVRRFTRLYCYSQTTTILTATLHLWDQVRSVGMGTEFEGSTVNLDWDPAIWHTMKIEGRIFNNVLVMSLYVDNVYTSLDASAGNAINMKLDRCSFYIYQNTIGSGDSIWVDNFRIEELENVNNTLYSTEFVTETVTQTETTTIAETTDTITTTATETIIVEETVTDITNEIHHETITETIQKTEQKAEVGFLSISLTVLSMVTLVLIVRINKRSK
ncbi:MAG: hypothetical protein GPJ54_10235 [Candidatus Heimdallarchaeota archaeon]|nr:hypothetical protein [Candidatus Heimdallarchaeota archaeon]